MYKIKLIGNVLIFVGLLLLIISILIDNIPLLSITGIVIVCIGFIFFLFFCQFLICHKHLPFNGMIGMKYCLYCRNEIDT